MFAALLMAVTWPFFAGRNAVDIATLALIYVMLGLGLNVVVGFAGLLDLGFVGFYAVGAYTYALLFHWADWSFLASTAPGRGHGGAVWLFAGLSGAALARRLLGHCDLGLWRNHSPAAGEPDRLDRRPRWYFWHSQTHGDRAWRCPAVPALKVHQTFHQFFGLEFNSVHMVIFLYLMALLLARGHAVLIGNRLIRMPIGRAWEALREDEIACRSLGLSPMKIKLSAFTLGAMFAGFGGAFFAARQGIVNPESFTFIESALILAIVVLGGMGSQLGVIVAAVLLTASA